MTYVKVWIGLVALTLVEAGLAWIRTAPTLMLALLLVLSLIKAALIAWWFMHLRTHRPKPLTVLIPMLFVFVGLLLSLLPDGIRAGAMR
ncbi:MAG: cytochrome C oxidase subunit IV family protein [Acidobacteria bacterium]|nr:cytochrome C oxidase subunit IV family protein [Acidobacteriota bacterium]